MAQAVTRQDRQELVRIKSGIGRRTLVLVGLPGAGKSTVGKRLAARLGLKFADADGEIERAAGMSIAEIFQRDGEPAFRAGERRVIARLLRKGPQVLATGGGAFMAEETRAAIAKDGISIWLDAPSSVLLARVARRSHRPLFNGVDPGAKLMELRAQRDPVFALAKVKVTSSSGPHDRVVDDIVRALAALVSEDQASPQPTTRQDPPRALNTDAAMKTDRP
ncbi:MAG: shikimate kinase [Devosia sp.]